MTEPTFPTVRHGTLTLRPVPTGYVAVLLTEQNQPPETIAKIPAGEFRRVAQRIAASLEKPKAKERQRQSKGRGKRGGKLPHLDGAKTREKVGRAIGVSGKTKGTR